MDLEQTTPLPPPEPRFMGVPTFMKLGRLEPATRPDVVIVGVPFDSTSSFRTGSRFAPRSIREASTTLKSYNREQAVHLLEDGLVADAADLPVIPGYIEQSYELISEGLEPILASGAVPVAIGGDHGISLPELRALHRRHGALALILLDSHRDCCQSHFGQPYGHGTQFRRAVEEGLIDPAASLIIGVRGTGFSERDLETTRDLGFEVVDIHQLVSLGFEAVAELASHRASDRKCFLSFDIDIVDPAYAPGTNTPEVGGLSSREALELLRGLDGLDYAGLDLVEVNPLHDPSGVTSLLAARIVFELVSLVLKHSCRDRQR